MARWLTIHLASPCSLYWLTLLSRKHSVKYLKSVTLFSDTHFFTLNQLSARNLVDLETLREYYLCKNGQCTPPTSVAHNKKGKTNWMCNNYTECSDDTAEYRGRHFHRSYKAHRRMLVFLLNTVVVSFNNYSVQFHNHHT